MDPKIRKFTFDGYLGRKVTQIIEKFKKIFDLLQKGLIKLKSTDKSEID